MSIVRVVLLSVACLLTGFAAANASEAPSASENIAAERLVSSPLLRAPATVRSGADKPIVLAGRRRRYRNGAIIGGIAVGVLGAIAAAEAEDDELVGFGGNVAAEHPGGAAGEEALPADTS